MDISGAAQADPADAQAVERLIDAASEKLVELVTLSALELCMLGGPNHMLFDEPVAQSWLCMPEPGRAVAMQEATRALADRGLLLEDRRHEAGSQPLAASYAASPPLALALAAKARPTYAVLCQADDAELRCLKMYALGDEQRPVRGVVVEQPQPTPPGDFRHSKKLGPLAWLYRYVLVSPHQAADVLAEWAIAPPRHSNRRTKDAARALSVFRHSQGQELLAFVLSVRGDGHSAIVGRDGVTTSSQRYDMTGVRGVMLDLLASAQP